MKKGILSQQPKVDPKIQEQADIMVANGIQIIHDQKVSDNIINQIKSSKDPMEGIANATLGVIERLEDSAGQNGIQISNDAKASAANQLMGEIINIAEIAGIPKLNDEQKYQAYSLAISKYLDKSVKSGKMSKEQLMQLSQEAQATPEGAKIAKQYSQAPQQAPAQPIQPVNPQTGGM